MPAVVQAPTSRIAVARARCRNHCLLLLPLFLCPLLSAASPQPPPSAPVAVVYESGVDAYAEALQGFTSLFPVAPSRLVDVAAAHDLAALDSKDVRLILAIGGRALAEVRAHRPAAPVAATMVWTDSGSGTVLVDLEIPLAAQLAVIRTLWPHRNRVGIIRNPAHSSWTTEALDARVRKEGYLPVIADCDGPANLLKAAASLKGKVDFVICFPDPTLYNPVTIKPLVLASLESRLPLMGFSPSFVRAGAAAGIFPDYREIGLQSAELAQRLLRGEELGTAAPRKLRVAVNQRIERLLGVDFQIEALRAEVFK